MEPTVYYYSEKLANRQIIPFAAFARNELSEALTKQETQNFFHQSTTGEYFKLASNIDIDIYWT